MKIRVRGTRIELARQNKRPQIRGRPVNFEGTTLWSTSLAPRAADPHAKPRERLRLAYLQFRDAVEPLAGEIANSMPMFTDHSISHIDALWDTASLLAGPAYELTPPEAFVLGGSFLLHDLGMGLVAYPGGVAKIREDQRFQDLVASLTRDETPEAQELADQLALIQYLRGRHAQQAEALMKQEFGNTQNRFYLLQDAGLRASYGATIGRIARSHWQDVDALPALFNTKLGPLGDYPPGWTVDPLKIACLLRTADAAQIDHRRAPMFLHAYRQPTGVSHDHWYFQERLTRPTLNDDRLQYVATDAFAAAESEAWWLAYETIGMIDAELKKVDALCAEEGRPRLVARSVAGAESAERLAKYIKTEAWQPIDASLKVNRVTDVVGALGGSKLYGPVPAVGLREIISNAADATRARRIQYGGSDLEILVELTQVGDDWTLSVRDRGLGMDGEHLVKYLTDFGASFWTSPENLSTYPGLLSRGYKSSGQFGIGFFACFMLADHVEVRSLKYRAASDSTMVLVFSEGVRGRPLLRRALEEEQLDLGGTQVILHLKHPPRSLEGLFEVQLTKHSERELLHRTLARMCGLLDVDLSYRVNDEPATVVVKADEWKTISPKELYNRLYLREDADDPAELEMRSAYASVFAANVEDITDENGDIIGRVALAAGLDELVSADQWWWPSHSAGVYVGGMEADRIYDVIGVFVGEPKTASRNAAFPVAQPAVLKQWAESQAEKTRTSKYSTPMGRYGAANLVRSAGSEARGLPLGFVRDGYITPDQLQGWIAGRDEVIVLGDFQVFVYYDESQGTVVADRVKHQRLDLPENVLIMESHSRWLFPEEILPAPKDERFTPLVLTDSSDWDPAYWWLIRGGRGAAALLLSSAAAAWNLDEVDPGMRLERRDYTVDGGDRRILVQRLDGSGHIKLSAHSFSRRPS